MTEDVRTYKTLLLAIATCIINFLLSDLHRQLVRRGVPYRAPHHHPQKTVNAMRMLSAISDHSTRVSVSHRLYQVRM